MALIWSRPRPNYSFFNASNPVQIRVMRSVWRKVTLPPSEMQVLFCQKVDQAVLTLKRKQQTLERERQGFWEILTIVVK